MASGQDFGDHRAASVPYKFLDLPLFPTKAWSIVYGANDDSKEAQAWGSVKALFR